jgi:MATE family multidrug resistance protein
VNKQILRLALPFIVSNFTVPLVSSVDTALMGNFASTAHLGAIGLGSAIFNFLYWNFAFIRMSAVGMTAQELGRDNTREVAALLSRSVVIALIGILLLLVFQSPICRLAFWITKGDEVIEAYAMNYYYVRIWAAPATIGLIAITGWFIGLQDAKTPLLIALLINSVNIVSSYIFVAHMDMSSRGVALGTVIGQYSGLCLALVILFSKYKHYILLIKLKEAFQFQLYRRFFSVNLDIFIRTLAVILVLTSYNFISAGKGELILGVNVIFLQMVYAFSFFIDGFANAAEALAGKYFGANSTGKLKKLIKYLFIWGVGIALIFTALYLFFWKSVMLIFTENKNIMIEASQYIGWIIAIPLISVLTFIWDGIFLGTTATAEQRNATVIASICFFITYYFLKNTIGNHALLLAQLVFFGMRGILQSFLFKQAIIKKLNRQAV